MIRRLISFALLWLSGTAGSSAVSLLTYNVAGNGTTDWSTNSAQVQAIARQVVYLNPDIVTFQEIPFTNSWQMTNFVTAFLPGYYLARNSGTDGFLRSVILSRFPITRSQKWLDGVSLIDFGVDARFARDLFEAEISLPGWPEPLHVFTTHLKSAGDSVSAARRGAEASAISNFFVTGFLPTNGHRPYVLTGDLNEDIQRPPSNTHQPLQRLVNAATGLHLTTPVSPVSGSDRTFSIRGSLTVRYDYILPSGLLFSNLADGQVFRTDLLIPTPPAVEKFDDKTASDHLPVLMVFQNPYDKPFRIMAIQMAGGQVMLQWESSPGRKYDVEISNDLLAWTKAVTNLTANATNFIWNAESQGKQRYLRIYRWP